MRTIPRRSRLRPRNPDRPSCTNCGYVFPNPNCFHPADYDDIILNHMKTCTAKSSIPLDTERSIDVDGESAPTVVMKADARGSEVVGVPICIAVKGVEGADEEATEPLEIEVLDQKKLSNPIDAWDNDGDGPYTKLEKRSSGSSHTPDLLESDSTWSKDMNTELNTAREPRARRRRDTRSEYDDTTMVCPECSRVFKPSRSAFFDPDAFLSKVTRHIQICSAKGSKRKKKDTVRSASTSNRTSNKVKPQNRAVPSTKKGKVTKGKSSKKVKPVKKAPEQPTEVLLYSANRKRPPPPSNISEGHILTQTWWRKGRYGENMPAQKKLKTRIEKPRTNRPIFDLQQCFMVENPVDDSIDAATPQLARRKTRASKRGPSDNTGIQKPACPNCRRVFSDSWLESMSEQAMEKHYIRCCQKREAAKLAEARSAQADDETESEGIPIEQRYRRELTDTEREDQSDGHNRRAAIWRQFLVGGAKKHELAAVLLGMRHEQATSPRK